MKENALWGNEAFKNATKFNCENDTLNIEAFMEFLGNFSQAIWSELWAPETKRHPSKADMEKTMQFFSTLQDPKNKESVL